MLTHLLSSPQRSPPFSAPHSSLDSLSLTQVRLRKIGLVIPATLKMKQLANNSKRKVDVARLAGVAARCAAAMAATGDHSQLQARTIALLDGIDASDISIAYMSATRPPMLHVNFTLHAALARALSRYTFLVRCRSASGATAVSIAVSSRSSYSCRVYPLARYRSRSFGRISRHCCAR
jgi:hypothetical protein